MIRPLVHAYYFPPIGGAGAQRPARFVRHLSELGYSPAVVTGAGKVGGRWTPRDETLQREIPAGVDVRRVEGQPPDPPAWRGRADRWIGVQPAWQQWWIEKSVAHALEIEGVDAIYTVMSPYSSAEAGFRLSRALGKPWIADLGDPWVLDEMMVYPTVLHRQYELRRMRRLLGTAAAIVTTTAEAARRLRQEFPELADRPIVSIPCGFDANDFAGPEPNRDDHAFRIVHTGYLHTELGRQQRHASHAHRLLGGGTPGVDILTRSHLFLLEAVDRLIADNPALASTIEIHLAGVLSPADREAAARSPVVRTPGYLTHADTIMLMRSADLLFLPMQNLPPGIRSATVPGKTYEYLASGRPILAAVPEGDARDILLQAGTAHICQPDDTHAIAAAIAAQRSGGASLPGLDTHFLRKFEYGHLSELVAEVIDHVAKQPGRRPRTHRPLGETAAVEPMIGFGATARRWPDPQPDGVSVLFLAYYFPPIGGAGAQRSVKFARYMPEEGVSVHVVTGSGVSRDRWSPLDESMAAELRGNTKVIRVGGPEPAGQGRWGQRAERWLGLESPWTQWWVEGAAAQGLELRGDVDVIVASMSPYASAEAAFRLSRALGKPWIAGLRDPWVLDEMLVYPTVLHRQYELRRMRRLLGTAAAIVTTTAEAARRLRQEFPELADRPIVSIPNGFDANDFAGPEPNRDDHAFRIVHTGYLHTELGRQQRHASHAHRLLGGGTPGVDILTRSHLFLLEAVDRLIADNPALASTIEIHLAGVLSPADREAAARSPVVRTPGYLTHADTIMLMRSADLLFLPMQNLPPGIRSATVPGKTYEYLASGRPILAAVPEGDARDILLQAGTAHICQPDDTHAIAAAIAAAVERWRSGRPIAEVSSALLAQFERRALTAEHAVLLRSVAGAARSGKDPGRALSAALAAAAL